MQWKIYELTNTNALEMKVFELRQKKGSGLFCGWNRAAEKKGHYKPQKSQRQSGAGTTELFV